MIPSFFMRNRSVFGWRPSRSAALADAVDTPAALPARVLDVHALDVVERAGVAAGLLSRAGLRRTAHRAAACRRSIESTPARRRSRARARCRASRAGSSARHHLIGNPGDAAAQFPLMVVDEEPDQRRDVLSPFAQRRHVESETRSAGRRGRRGTCPSADRRPPGRGASPR